MAGIYFIIPHQGNRGYIGLDSNMSAKFFPRLYDHVYGAYQLGRSYYGSTEGAVKANIQGCEKEMADQLCCNFDYKIILKEEDCYGLGQGNYDEFCKIWNSTYKEPEMSWAEVCYIYKYYRNYAALNEAWGGAGKFLFNVNSLKDVSVGDTTLKQLATDANITWFPIREGRTLAHMNDLFFPYAKVFNTVITYYINNVIAPKISNTLYEQLSTKELWENALVNGNPSVNIDVDKIVKSLHLATVYNAIVESAPKNDYVFPSIADVETQTINALKNAIKGILKHIQQAIDSLYTQSGKFHGGRINTTFNIKIPLQKWCTQKKTKKEFPNWWPKETAFSTATNVTRQMKELIPKEVFPYIVKHAQNGAPGISKINVQTYLSTIMPKLTDHAGFKDDFYLPCQRYWLKEKDGPATIINETEDNIIFNRPAWGPDAFETLSKEKFNEDFPLESLKLW